jgi:hypothetical protein
MNQLSELEAAAESLPTEHKRELVQFLLSRLRDEGVDTADLYTVRHSVLDIKSVSLGRVLQRFDSDVDLLGDMLEGH